MKGIESKGLERDQVRLDELVRLAGKSMDYLEADLSLRASLRSNSFQFPSPPSICAPLSSPLRDTNLSDL